MKESKSFFAEEMDERPPTPERKLWMAVIDRALKDYCLFFDQLQLSNQKEMLNIFDKSRQTGSKFNIKAIREFERLNWFLFCPSAEEFNLTFLSEQFFEDYEGVADTIRKVAKRQFKKNMNDAEALGLFPVIREQISLATAADTWIPAESYVLLRQKRYRN